MAKTGDVVHGANGEWGLVFKMLNGDLRIAWVGGYVTDCANNDGSISAWAEEPEQIAEQIGQRSFVRK